MSALNDSAAIANDIAAQIKQATSTPTNKPLAGQLKSISASIDKMQPKIAAAPQTFDPLQLLSVATHKA